MPLNFVKRGLRKFDYLQIHPRYLGYAIRPDTEFWSKAYYDIMRRIHAKEFAERQRALRAVTRNLEDSIDPVAGYLVKDMSGHPVVDEALGYCDAVRRRAAFQDIVTKSKKPFLRSFEFDLDDERNRPIFDLACDPLLLGPIAEYLGCVPVLHRAALSYSPNQVYVGSSQRYHRDTQDYRQVKCFIYLDEVTEDSGPLTIIPAAQSRQIYDRLFKQKQAKRRHQSQDDDEIYGLGVVDRGLPLCGPRGSASFVDTCACYHYGSRPGSRPRYLLYYHFASPFSIDLPVWGRRPEPCGYQPANGRVAPETVELVLGLFDRVLARAR